ncbi:MAG TPA: hydrogenase, partial [Sporomusaceae bacterium]|nr:hydrogenase [Sporomusaceae bacterium]
MMGRLVAALRRIGFDEVFDTTTGADLTVLEETGEFLGRLEKGEKLPLFTSCCPAWVRYAELHKPELVANISTCRSPMQMFASVLKEHYRHSNTRVVVVAVMPCTAKKFECARPEMNAAGVLHGKPEIRDVDIVLTTRELARLMKKRGIDLNTLTDAPYDRLMGESTGAGVIFGVTGGVMEAAVRSAYYLVTKQDPPETLLTLTPVRGLAGVKEASVTIPGVGELQVA